MAASSEVRTRNVSPRSRSLPTLDRDVALFLGLAGWGPINTKQTITDPDDVFRYYGYTYASGELVDQLNQFFLNGGRKAIVNRVAHLSNYLTGRTLATAAKAAKTVQTAASAPTQGSVTGTETAPFALVHGDTLVGSVDAAGNQTATISAVQATITSGSTETYALSNGQDLTVKIDGGAVQTITFLTGSFVNIAAATAAEVAAVINASILGASSTAPATAVIITSDTYGTGSHVEVTGGTANAALGFSATVADGSGNVADVSAVTVAELKTIVEAAWTNGGGVTVSDSSGSVKITANTAGSSGSVQVIATSTADDELGLDNAVHAGLDGTAVDTLTVTAKYEGERGNTFTFDIAAASNGDAEYFNLALYESGVQLGPVFANLTMDSTSDDYVETRINGSSGSDYITVTDEAAVGTATQRRPDNATAQALTGGDDGLTSLNDNDFIGSTTYGTGLYSFDDLSIGDAALFAIPDRPVAAVINAAVNWCVDNRKRTVQFIPDVPAGNTASQAATFRSTITPDEQLDGLCWPRITIPNPNKSVHGTTATITVATSGSIMGALARNTLTYQTDVATQPGNESTGRLRNVAGLESTESNKILVREYLTSNRINPIVAGKDANGIYGVWRNDVMGSDSTANFPSIGEARFVALIRAVILRYLESERNTPNTPQARSIDKHNIEAFMGSWLGKGIYAADNAADAFYVNTDIKGTSINNPVEQEAERYTVVVAPATARPRRFMELWMTRDNRARDLFVQQQLAAV